MSHFNTGYNQLLQLIPRHQFETLVKRHEAGPLWPQSPMNTLIQSFNNLTNTLNFTFFLPVSFQSAL